MTRTADRPCDRSDVKKTGVFVWLAPAILNLLTPMPVLGELIVSPGESIQAAINAAQPGETIVVEAGTYVEDLLITESLSLVSESGPASTVIQGVATTPGSSFPLVQPNIDIRADDVTISGFTIRSPEVAADEYSSSIVLTGTNVEIAGNEFLVATGDVSIAIQTWFSPPPAAPGDVSGLWIHDNTFTDLIPIGTGLFEGIFINPQEDLVDTANPVLIESNAFSGPLVRAVAAARPRMIIRNNNLSTNAGTVFGSFPRGIDVTGADVRAEENVIAGFERGVRVALDLSSNSEVVIRNSSISGNNVGVAFVGAPNGFTVDAASNWWGDPSGPSGCSACTGTGDAVDENVQFAPWLTAPPTGVAIPTSTVVGRWLLGLLLFAYAARRLGREPLPARRG